MCWTKDGFLIVAEHNRVLNFPAAEFFYEGPDVAVIEVVPRASWFRPKRKATTTARAPAASAPTASSTSRSASRYNVPPRDKVATVQRSSGIGGIVRMDPFDGSKREVFATGVRNSVGQDFNPKDGTLWFTDNQTDGLGDEVPPGELNRATKLGQDFGYPYWNGKFKVAGSAAAPDLKDLPEPKDAVFPQIEFPAHQAQLGMTFYSGKMFPAKYQGGIFVAAHGSWNRSKPTGALVDFVSLKAEAAPTSPRSSPTAGSTQNGIYRGRPVDVAVMKDGSLLVSDDFAGAIYRISYAAP